MRLATAPDLSPIPYLIFTGEVLQRHTKFVIFDFFWHALDKLDVIMLIGKASEI